MDTFVFRMLLHSGGDVASVLHGSVCDHFVQNSSYSSTMIVIHFDTMV